MDTSKLFRKPLTDKKREAGEVTFVESPDKKLKIAFSHFLEVSMGAYEGVFSLLDCNDNIIDGFEPLTVYSHGGCCWNSESTLFAISVNYFDYGYLIVNILDDKIAFVKMLKPWPLDISFRNDTLIVSYNDYSLELTNSTGTFKGGPLEIPSKIYLKPPDIELRISELTFFERKCLKDLESLTISDKRYQLDKIDGGFREYKGVFPKNTKHVYNTRQLEVYQLEAFAEFGDKQSQEWLETIRKKTDNNYNRWTKVSEYIGFLERRSDL